MADLSCFTGHFAISQYYDIAKEKVQKNYPPAPLISS